jgi:hypothetical protein
MAGGIDKIYLMFLAYRVDNIYHLGMAHRVKMFTSSWQKENNISHLFMVHRLEVCPRQWVENISDTSVHGV